jgi:hypothetical protein
MWVVLGGSLVAVAVMTAIAWALKLGGGRIASEAEAIAAAEQMLSGFEGARVAIGSDGQAALVRGTDGSVAVLKMHGAQIAARRVRPPVEAEPGAEGLCIATGERRFGAVLVRGVAALP